jgi:hypothetical protein
MRRFIRATALLVLLAAISACGGGSSNPIAPQFQPQVINNVDSFSFQVTGVQNASSTLNYSWQNSGTTATVNQSASISGGSATLVILDASGTQVYSQSLSANGTFVTAAGTTGLWTIRVVFSGTNGTVNFRSDKA